MWFYWFVSISGRHNLGGSLGIDFGIGHNGITDNIIGEFDRLILQSAHSYFPIGVLVGRDVGP